MKNIKKLWYLLVAVTVLFSVACSDDDDGGEAGAATEGTITAKIDGADFESLKITSFANVVTQGSTSTLTLQGNTQDQAISIVVNGYNGVGTYQISDSNVFIVASYIEPDTNNPQNSKIWSAPYANSGVIGEIKVAEETDTTVTGTFNFTGKNNNDGTTRVVSNGSFELQKQ